MTDPANPPAPGQPMQILLPQPLQDIMQAWPGVLARVAACEAKPRPTSSSGWMILASALAGAGGMALGVWLWSVRSLWL